MPSANVDLITHIPNLWFLSIVITFFRNILVLTLAEPLDILDKCLVSEGEVDLGI